MPAEFDRLRGALTAQTVAIHSKDQEKERLQGLWDDLIAPFETPKALQEAVGLLDELSTSSPVVGRLRRLYKLDTFDESLPVRQNVGSFKNIPLHVRLAYLVGFKYMNLNSRDPATNPFYTGFDHKGSLPDNLAELFSEGRGLKQSEIDHLLEVRGLEDQSPDSDGLESGASEAAQKNHKSLLNKPFEDRDLLIRGWAQTKLKLVDGIRISEEQSEEELGSLQGVASPSFYVGQKWDPATGIPRKIRLIIDDRHLNRLSPISCHLTLPSHRLLAKAVCFCLGKEDLPWQQLKNSIQESIDENRRSSASDIEARLVLDNLLEQTASPSPAPDNAFVPILSTIDLSDAYYQYGYSSPSLIAPFNTEPQVESPWGKWGIHKSFALTFGNVRSVFTFVVIGCMIQRVLDFMGIPIVVYIDDFVIISKPGFETIHYIFVVRLFRALGLKITTKEDGAVLGMLNTDIEILGLLYRAGRNQMKIRISKERALDFKKQVKITKDQILSPDGSLTNLVKTKDLASLLGSANFITTFRLFRPEAPFQGADLRDPK